jgi:hypothetical protein
VPMGGPLLEPIHCTWGSDPRPECRTKATCRDVGGWQVTESDDVVCAEPALPPSCPANRPNDGTVCSDEGPCWYPDGPSCFCSPCVNGSEYPLCQPIDPPEWACRVPPAGCPATLPQAGSACDQEGLSCGPDCEISITCEDGIWRWATGMCPICASPDTPIATPAGERPIASIRRGDLVYSIDGGALAAVPVVSVASTPAVNHEVVRLVLEGGATLEMSPGHPTASGAAFGDLAPGDALDPGHRVVATSRVPYLHARTYDILPDSDTGTYVAAGAVVGSTLHGALSFMCR